MSVFDALFDTHEVDASREVEKENMKQKQEQMTLMAQGHFLVISEKYRRQMNMALSFTEKYKIALELIRELTGDEIFYITHMKDLGVMPEDNKNIKEAMQNAIAIDASRRMQIHFYRYEQEKTALNEFIYESAKIDSELLLIDRRNFESDTAYEKEIEKKILEKQSLVEIYKLAVKKGVDKIVC